MSGRACCMLSIAAKQVAMGFLMSRLLSSQLCHHSVFLLLTIFQGLLKPPRTGKKKHFLTHCSKHTHTPTHKYETIPPLPNKLTVLFSLCPAAPSIVPIMHQISSTMNSFTLSWPQPEQPNGIILDYELRFYEKVR